MMLQVCSISVGSGIPASAHCLSTLVNVLNYKYVRNQYNIDICLLLIQCFLGYYYIH